MDLEMILKYPFLFQYKKNDTVVYKGFITYQENDFDIEAEQLPNGFKLNLDSRLSFTEDIINKLEQNQTIYQVLKQIEALITAKFNRRVENLSGQYKKVLLEYKEFLQFFTSLESSRLSADFTEIEAKIRDEAGRIHNLKITFDFDSKSLFNITKYNLPIKLDKKLVSNSSLIALFNQFLNSLDLLQPFFNLMDTIDNISWVLDPLDKETIHSHNYRRIYLDPNMSVTISFNPLNMGAMPSFTFLGPDDLVQRYLEKVSDYLEKWNPKLEVLKQIFEILGVNNFVQKPEEKDNNLLKESQDCSICFCSRLNDKLPEVTCSNRSCNNQFHQECLYEWLMSVNGNSLFSEVVGSCPNCEKTIFCPTST